MDRTKPLSATNRPARRKIGKAKRIERETAQAQPAALFRPLFDGEGREIPMYGGVKSIAPYSSAREEAAHNIAALVCPPMNAPSPHVEDVLQWPCDGCKLWAAGEVIQLVNGRLATFPRFARSLPDAPEIAAENPTPKPKQKSAQKPAKSTGGARRSKGRPHRGRKRQR